MARSRLRPCKRTLNNPHRAALNRKCAAFQRSAGRISQHHLRGHLRSHLQLRRASATQRCAAATGMAPQARADGSAASSAAASFQGRHPRAPRAAMSALLHHVLRRQHLLPRNCLGNVREHARRPDIMAGVHGDGLLGQGGNKELLSRMGQCPPPPPSSAVEQSQSSKQLTALICMFEWVSICMQSHTSISTGPCEHVARGITMLVARLCTQLHRCGIRTLSCSKCQTHSVCRCCEWLAEALQAVEMARQRSLPSDVHAVEQAKRQAKQQIRQRRVAVCAPRHLADEHDACTLSGYYGRHHPARHCCSIDKRCAMSRLHTNM